MADFLALYRGKCQQIRMGRLGGQTAILGHNNMDKSKLEQDIISAADCWARGIMVQDRVLNLAERNL